jgi:hypothetical protein
MPAASGTDTPKDLAARVTILELFTLHVLPRNEEWDYAREFINLSEVLDDERKEAFLQTLDGLREEKERGNQRAAEIQREKEEELERLRLEQERNAEQQKTSISEKLQTGKGQNAHRKTSSEVDYGIEKSHPNGISKARNAKPTSRPGKTIGRTAFSPPPEASKQVKKVEKLNSVLRQTRMAAHLLVALVRNLGRSMSNNPMPFLRSLLLIVGVLMALSRPDVRDRIRRITDAGWQKIRRTVGMGVKVSYI